MIIIGGGPSGLAVGIEAKRAGLRVCILEKGMLVDSLYHFPTNTTFFSTSRLLEIGDVPFISHGDKPTRREALEYYRRVREHWDLKVRFFEAVERVEPGPSGGYAVHSARAEYFAQSVVVATGFYGRPRKMDVPGENLPKVTHYYTEPHPYIGQEILVVGAANSACDVALETYAKGASVTMAVRGPEINPKVKYWIRPNIINRIAEGAIRAHFQTKVLEIHERHVILEGPEGAFSINNDFVLAMTGYQPDFSFLTRIGIRLEDSGDRIPIHNPETLETVMPNVYVAGVVAGGMQTSRLFIENTREHGERIVTHFLSSR
jgi:thioredoxin reductase (NADPH)